MKLVFVEPMMALTDDIEGQLCAPMVPTALASVASGTQLSRCHEIERLGG